MKQDISTRQDIRQLVVAFYDKIQDNELLGPIFKKSILDWPSHYEHLTNFWESGLFITKATKTPYKGNPIEAHNRVDKQEDYGITQTHFGTWLNLWFETIDTMYAGEVADRAKRKAQKMSTFMFMQIFNSRPKK